MIFKTTQQFDENGNVVNQELTTWLKARKIAQDELNASLAKQAAVLETDEIALRKLEDAVKGGATYTEVCDDAMKGASITAKEYAVQTQGVAGTTDVFVAKQKEAQKQLKATANASNIASKALKVLSAVGNMLVMWAVSEAISFVVEAVDEAIVTNEEYLEQQDEIISKTKEVISSTESRIDSLEDLSKKLKETNGNQAEMLSLSKDINSILGEGKSKILDQVGAYTLLNAQIEREIELEKQKKEEAEREKRNASFSKAVHATVTETSNFNEELTLKEVQGKFVGKDSNGMYVKIGDSGAYYEDVGQLVGKYIEEHLINNDNNITTQDVADYYAKAISSYNDYSFNGIQVSKEELTNTFESALKDLYDSFDYAINNGEGFLTSADKQNVVSSLYLQAGGVIDNEWSKHVNDVLLSLDKDGSQVTKKLEEYSTSLSDGIKGNEDVIYEELKSMISTLKETYPEVSFVLDSYFTDIVSKLNKGSKEIEKENSISVLSQTKIDKINEYQSKLNDLYEALNLIVSGTAKSTDIDALIDKFPELSDDTEDLESAIKSLINNALFAMNNLYGESIDNVAEFAVRQNALDHSINNTASAIDNITSSYESLNNAIKEYNENGFVSLGTLEQIMKLEPKYLAALMDEEGNIVANTYAYRDLILMKLKDYELEALKEANLTNAQLKQDYENGSISKVEYEAGLRSSDSDLMTKLKFVNSAERNIEKLMEELTSSSSSTSDFEQQIDWASNSISNLEHEVSNLETTLDNTNGWKAQIDAIDAVIKAQEKLKDGYKESVKVYNDEYEKVLTSGILADQGLTNKTREKIESGKEFSIEDFIAKNVKSDEESIVQQVYDAIQEAIDWYNKTTDASDNVIEINYKISDNIKEQRQITWDYFDEIIKRIHSVIEESEFLIELFSDDKLIRKTGEFTSSGLATLGQRMVNYNVYLDEAERYAKELKNIYNDLSNATEYDQELIDRARSLQDAQRDSILGYQDEKQAIIELTQEAIQQQIDYTSELIEKKKELLEQEKDELDFQREIEERTKSLNNLKKMESVYSLDNSEEGQQRLQTIRAEIEEAEKDMDEFTYDKWHQTQTEMLDNIFSDYETLQNELMDDTERLFKNMMNVVGENSNTISDAIKDIADDVGVELSPEFEGISLSLSEYASGLDVLEDDQYGLKAIKEVLERIASKEYSNYSTTQDSTSKGANDTGKNAEDSSVDKPTSNDVGESTPSSDGSKDGKINKGDKVIFASGVYRESSDGSGNIGKESRGEEVYVTKISNSKYAKFPFHISKDKKNKKPLGWVNIDQLSGYATGLHKAKKDEWAWTQENGTEIIRTSDGALLTPIGKGSSVFSAEATQKLWDFANSNIPLSNMKVVDYGRLNKTNAINIESAPVNVNFNLPNVKNYPEFMSEMQRDPKFEKMVQNMTVGVAMGRSKFSKYN